MIPNPNGSLEEKLLWMRHRQAQRKAAKEQQRLRKRMEGAQRPARGVSERRRA